MSDQPTDKRQDWLMEGRYPTPEEWCEYFLSVDAEQQLRIAGIVIRQAEEAMACFARNHQALQDEVQSLQQALHVYNAANTAAGLDA